MLEVAESISLSDLPFLQKKKNFTYHLDTVPITSLPSVNGKPFKKTD